MPTIQETIDSIEEKLGDAYTAVNSLGGTIPSAMNMANLASAINTIPTGTDISDTTAVAGDVLSGKYFYTSDGSKTAGAIPTYSGSMSFTPSTVAHTVSTASQYLSGDITIDAIPSQYKDTTNATVSAGDILAGKVAVNGGGDVTGTIQTYSGASTINANGVISIAGQYAPNDITVNVSGDDTRFTDLMNGTISQVIDSSVYFLRSYILSGTSVQVVDLPKCKTIYSYALNNTTNLVSVNLPYVSYIQGSSALTNCKLLSELSLPRLLYGVSIFSNTSFTSLNLPLFMGSVGNILQNDDGLSQIDLPVISSAGFYSCKKLESINAPCTKSVYAYSCPELETILAPMASSVILQNCGKVSQIQTLWGITNWASNAFANCYALKSIELSTNIVGQSAFYNCSTLSCVRLIAYGTGNTIPSGAFMLCKNLSQVYLPSPGRVNINNVNVFASTPIENDSYLGYYGSIYVPSSLVDSYKTATNWATYSDRITELPADFWSQSISWSKYSSSTLTEIPSEELNCVEVMYAAFLNCTSLSEVNLPYCKSIGAWAFSSCTNLTTVSLPECEIIKGQAFYRCTKLSSLYLPKVKYIYDAAFQQCGVLSEIELPELLYINFYSYDTGSVQFGNGLKTFSAPKLKKIGMNCFNNCYYLSSIYAPELTYLGWSNFNGNLSIRELSFPKLAWLGGVISGCASLSTIYFPNLISATLIANNCANLRNVTLGVYSLWWNGNANNCTFVNCPKIESLTLTAPFVVTGPAYSILSNTAILNFATLGHYGSVYVPASLVDAYKVASNWESLSDRITAIPE